MCVYCFVGDWHFRRDPPWEPTDVPAWPATVPRPMTPGPIKPWPADKLKELLDMLDRIKKLEDQLGCPCEPNKADYIELIKQRLDELEKRA